MKESDAHEKLRDILSRTNVSDFVYSDLSRLLKNIYEGGNMLDIENWNKQDAEILRAKLKIATDAGEESFTLMGQVVLTSYAKYLVAYLENQRILS